MHQEDLRTWTDVFSALGSEPRLHIVALLARGETRCREILEQIDLSQPAVSYHMAKLERAGILEKRREGTQYCYRLRDEIRSLIRCLFEEDE